MRSKIIKKLKHTNYQILLFGVLMAILLLIFQTFKYHYFIGNLKTEYYTAIIAILFTISGAWLGLNFIKKQETKPQKTSSSKEIKRTLHFDLNDREYEVLHLISKGYTNQEIADQLFLALPTIKTHASNLYMKLDVKNRTQAVHKARQLNLIPEL